jgi:hypothetical protein
MYQGRSNLCPTQAFFANLCVSFATFAVGMARNKESIAKNAKVPQRGAKAQRGRASFIEPQRSFDNAQVANRFCKQKRG